MSLRPALLPLNHPLSYSYSPTASHVNGGRDVAETISSLSSPSSLEDRVRYLYEHQQITDLLNEYAYVLDVCMVDHGAAEKWAGLFTDDCDVTYPFGNHRGKAGLATWAMNAENRFYRMLHASSNFTITFDANSDNVAHARTALHAVCGTDATDLGKTFHEGGYYYWSFRKDEQEGGKWKISYLFLDVNWTSGDSLGLNEPGAADKGALKPHI